MEYLCTNLRNSEAQGPVKARKRQSELYGERRDHHGALCEMNSTMFVMGARTEWAEFYSHRPKSRDGTSTAGSHLVWLLARAPAECQRAPISFLRCLLYNLSNDLVAHGRTEYPPAP